VQSQGYAKILQNAATIELLMRMCKLVRRKPGAENQTADDYELALNSEGKLQDAFPGATWMRAWMTDDEVAVLIAAYHRVQLKIGPIVVELSDPACDLWLEKLIAGGVASDPLDSLGSDARADLVMRSVFHLANYRKGIFSFGLPLGSGESEPSPTDSDEPDDGPPQAEDEEIDIPETSELAPDPHGDG
jgi:hypothetical protein